MATIQTRTTTTTRTIHGTLKGKAWAGFAAELPFTLQMHRGEKLPAALDRAVRECGGDFERCAVDVEQTSVYVRRVTVRRGRQSLAMLDRSRVVPLDVFKSTRDAAGAADVA